MENQNKDLKREFRGQNIILLIAILIAVICTGFLTHPNLDWDSDDGYKETTSWEEKYHEMMSERNELKEKLENCERNLNNLNQ
jgi:aromatic ring-opening dioxygenase catalytic subunit (LigB family)